VRDLAGHTAVRRAVKTVVLRAGMAAALVVGCSSAARATVTPAPNPTLTPSAATSTPAQSRAASATGAPSLGATPVASEPASRSPFDGIWATPPLTRDDFVAAVSAAGLSTAAVDEVLTPPDSYVDYIIFELEIRDGRWTQYENVDGNSFGIGWDGTFVSADDDTVVARDQYECDVTYDLLLGGSTLEVDMVNDACEGPADAVIQTAIYESAPFHLVEPVEGASLPEPPPPGPRATAAPSTSRDRYTQHPRGSVAGAELGYIEYLPPDYGDDTLSPLILFLHGSGESGEGDPSSLGLLSRAGIPQVIVGDQWPDDRPFVVLAPQHTKVAPTFCFTVEEVTDFLAFALEHYRVDPARVYLTGLSCGAIAGWNYLAEHSNEVVAAAALIAGNGYAAVDTLGCDLGAVPIWAFHGADDEAVPPRGSTYPITFLDQCTDPAPVDARLTVYPDVGHDSWTMTYHLSAGNDIYSWFLSHSK
jgi:predicted esterase